MDWLAGAIESPADNTPDFKPRALSTPGDLFSRPPLQAGLLMILRDQVGPASTFRRQAIRARARDL